MSNDKKLIIGILAFIAIILSVGLVVDIVRSPSKSFVVDGDLSAIGSKLLAENYIPVVKFNDGYYSEKAIWTTSTFRAGGTVTMDGAATIGTSLSVGTTLTVGGLLTTNAGYLRSYTNSTSTIATTQTLELADVLDYTSVIFTPNTGSVTLTFFASSSAETLVPAAGDSFEQCWYNATTTAGINITFAAGTDIALQVATSSTQAGAGFDLTFGPGEKMCLSYFRAPATATTFTIEIGLLEFNDGD